MKYSNSFKALLDSMPEGYLGHGNPNAKILFIGQEPAINRQKNARQYELEISGNAAQWRDIVSDGIGYESIDRSKIEFGSPLHPWANQKFGVRSEMHDGTVRGEQGTAKTWYNYQKLINKIFELYSNDRKPMTADDYLDFHQLSFHTDMSDAASEHHTASAEGETSVAKRVPVLSADFFRNFPIVIAAVGHFPRDTYGDAYFGDILGVEFLGNEETEPSQWMNVSLRSDGEHPVLLIHTPQFSKALSDRFLDQIAHRVVDFAREHHIDLLPEE